MYYISPITNNKVQLYTFLLQYMKENPDYSNPLYKTKTGVYSEGCGLENVMISWGHDDYMYMVCVILLGKI